MLLLPEACCFQQDPRGVVGSFSWCHSGKKKQIDDVSPIKKGWFSSQTPCLVFGEWRQDITSLNPPVYGSTPHTPGVVGWEGTKVAIVERQALWRETKARDLGVGFKRPVDSGESRDLTYDDQVVATHIFLLSPLIIREMIQIWRSHFSRWVGEKPPTRWRLDSFFSTKPLGSSFSDALAPEVRCCGAAKGRNATWSPNVSKTEGSTLAMYMYDYNLFLIEKWKNNLVV